MSTRTRMSSLIAICAVAAFAMTGCTNGADEQYANDGVLASGAAGGSLADQVGGSDSIFGGGNSRYDTVSGDSSMTDGIPGDYGTVPGAMSIGSNSTLLNSDDDVTNSSPFDSIALEDPTASTSRFDSSSDDLDSTLDGLTSATDTNFDSALDNAQSMYSAASTDPSMNVDPDLAMDDPTLGLDPGAGLGADSLPDF